MNENNDELASDELESTVAQFKRTTAEPDFAALHPLPGLMLVTLRQAMRPGFDFALAAALRGGARLIQLRESFQNPDAASLQELASITDSACRRSGARWVLNGEETAARALGASGVHWPEREIPPVPAPRPGNFLRGASIHSAAKARAAVHGGADYLVFGSIWETASHPGGVAAGLHQLREICAISPVPVYAIGGVTAARVADCRAAGAHGVAVLRAVWDAADIEAATRELVAALEAT